MGKTRISGGANYGIHITLSENWKGKVILESERFMMQNVLLYEKKLLLLSRWFHFSANMCTKIFNNHAAKREVFVQIFCIHWRELWWLKTIRYHLWRDYRNSPKSNSASASAIHEHCGDEKNPVNSVKVRISAQPLFGTLFFVHFVKCWNSQFVNSTLNGSYNSAIYPLVDNVSCLDPEALIFPL